MVYVFFWSTEKIDEDILKQSCPTGDIVYYWAKRFGKIGLFPPKDQYMNMKAYGKLGPHYIIMVSTCIDYNEGENGLFFHRASTLLSMEPLVKEFVERTCVKYTSVDFTMINEYDDMDTKYANHKMYKIYMKGKDWVDGDDWIKIY